MKSADYNKDSVVLDLPDETATMALGGLLAARLPARLVIGLEGDLGAGKTTLCRGILRGLGVRGAVKSPTFTLVEPYDLGDRQIFHFDLYRLGDPSELEYIGVDDYFGENRLCLVEWPERGGGYLPDCDLRIRLDIKDDGRRVSLRPESEQGRDICRKLETRRIES